MHNFLHTVVCTWNKQQDFSSNTVLEAINLAVNPIDSILLAVCIISMGDWLVTIKQSACCKIGCLK